MPQRPIEDLLGEFVGMLNTADEKRLSVWVEHAIQENPQLQLLFSMGTELLFALFKSNYPQQYRRLAKPTEAKQKVVKLKTLKVEKIS